MSRCQTPGSTSLVIFVIAIALATAFDDRATLEVDALVNDDENEPLHHPLATPLTGQFFEQPRRSTPSIPPGFTAPAIPRALADGVASRPGSRPGSRPMSRTTSSTIVPAVPVVPVTPLKPETPMKGRKGKQGAKPTETVDPTPAASSKTVSKTPTKSSTKAVTPETPATADPLNGTAADAATKKPEPRDQKTVPETPAKATAKSKTVNKKADKVEKVEKAVVTPEEKIQKAAAKEVANALVTLGPPSANAKRQPPGKLEIPAAKVVEKEIMPSMSSRKEEPQAKAMRTGPPTTTTSVPASPAVAAPSPVKHTAAPRTLRLVSTPKVETPPVLAAPTPQLPQIPTVDKLRSRQASIASLNQPGTPISELISDTASMTSGMISRANSPPPQSNIVGSAPVRKITKAQAKKNRQERKRQEEEKEKPENESDIEVVQAPIIGRKKKAKKSSTTPKPVAAMASAMKEAAAKSQPASPKSATVEDEPLETSTLASVKAQSAHNSASATPEPEVQPDDARERREPSAQSILNDLQKTGHILVSALEFFKPLSSTLTHTSRASHSAPPSSPLDQRIHFSQADLDALAKKKPVHLNGDKGKPDSRTLVTPSGKFLWGLTAELEERALSLESDIERLNGYLRFHPSSHTSQHNTSSHSSSDMLPAIATALKEAGKKMPNSPTNTLTFDYKTYAQHLPPVTEFTHQPPPPVQQQTPADAGAYLNQFVLPATDNPPPNHPRPEMAAVGGTPGSGTSQISIASTSQQGTLFERAARALVDGGAVGSTDIDGVASMVPDKSGGVWLSGLQGLVSAGIPSISSAYETESTERFLRDLEHLGWDRRNPRNLETLQGYLDKGKSPGVVRSERSVLGLEEAESVLLGARREQEQLERKLASLVKRNRKAALGNVR